MVFIYSLSSTKREQRKRTLLTPSEGEVVTSEILMRPSFLLDTRTLIIYPRRFVQTSPLLADNFHPPTHLTHQREPQSPPTLPLSQALRSTWEESASIHFRSPDHSSGSKAGRRLSYLHTRAHRIWRPNPLRPYRIYFAELFDVDHVDSPAHDFVEAGVGGFEAGFDVTHCLMLGRCQLVEAQRDVIIDEVPLS